MFEINCRPVLYVEQHNLKVTFLNFKSKLFLGDWNIINHSISIISFIFLFAIQNY